MASCSAGATVISPATFGNRAVDVLGAAAGSDRECDCGREQRAGLSAHRVRVRYRGILPGPLQNVGRLVVRPEDPEGADPHQGAVGLTLGIGSPRQPGSTGGAAVIRAGLEPPDVRFTDRVLIVPALLDEGSRQHQGHLGVVRRLTGQRVPGAAAGQFPDSRRMTGANRFRRLELDEAAQRVTGELAEQAPLGPTDNSVVAGSGQRASGSKSSMPRVLPLSTAGTPFSIHTGSGAPWRWWSKNCCMRMAQSLRLASRPRPWPSPL